MTLNQLLLAAEPGESFHIQVTDSADENKAIIVTAAVELNGKEHRAVSELPRHVFRTGNDFLPALVTSLRIQVLREAIEEQQ